jgi:LPS export ABC transporter permease LptG
MPRLHPMVSRLLLVVALFLAGGLLACVLVPREITAVKQQLFGFPDSDAFSHGLRPWILAGLCAIPGISALFYACSSTLDRYLVRQFLGVFGICISALFSIWLLVDLSDKVGDFRNAPSLILAVLEFYLTSAPAILLQLLPYGLLLSLIHCLGKCSANRELVSMIQAGRGIGRICLPLVVAGAFCTLLATGLNYHWAPVAEGSQDEILAKASGRQITDASKVMFRAPETQRLWMISAFPPNYELGKPLLGVEVTTTSPDRKLLTRLTAREALWDRQHRRWTFFGATEQTFRDGEAPLFVDYPAPLVRADWPETPWQLIKPGLSAKHLGIPDLNGWLHANQHYQVFADPSPYLTQWHYRWAFPFTCLVTVMLAAPLSIHFSRRGAGGGVFMAVVLSALMLLTSGIVLAFGESGLLTAPVAAWLPNAFFLLLGAGLFRRRISGKPLLGRWRRRRSG